jgi:hypothetical protein
MEPYGFLIRFGRGQRNRVRVKTFPRPVCCPSAPALAQVHLVNQLVNDGVLAVAQAPGSSYKSPISGYRYRYL